MISKAAVPEHPDIEHIPMSIRFDRPPFYSGRPSDTSTDDSFRGYAISSLKRTPEQPCTKKITTV